jgi:hypothetical protein
MAVTQEFRDAVKAGDIRLVRIMLKDSMVVDPSFREFGQMMGFAGEMTDLFDSHDGEELKYDNSAWTKDYMNEQMVQIVYNFSEERLELLKDICGYIYGKKTAGAKTERKQEYSANPKTNTTTNTNTSTNTNTDINFSRKQIGAGVAVAGVAVAVAGVALSKALVIGAGVACIVVGGAMIITDK